LYSASKNPNTGGRLTPMQQNDEDEAISTRFVNRSSINNSYNNKFSKNGGVFPKGGRKGTSSVNQ